MFIVEKDQVTNYGYYVTRHSKIVWKIKTYSDVDLAVIFWRSSSRLPHYAYFRLKAYFDYDLNPPLAGYNCVLNEPFFYQISIKNQASGTQEIRIADVTFALVSAKICYFITVEVCTTTDIYIKYSINPNTGVFQFLPEQKYAIGSYCIYYC